MSIHEVAFRSLKISDCTAGSEGGPRPLSGCSSAKFEEYMIFAGWEVRIDSAIPVRWERRPLEILSQI